MSRPMDASDSPKPRVLSAALMGLLAALTGAAVWYGVMVATGKEFGLLAIVLGLWVGGAVRLGSGGRGGVACQVLAVLLTYAAIAASYVPVLSEELAKQAVASAAQEEGSPAVERAALSEEDQTAAVSTE